MPRNRRYPPGGLAYGQDTWNAVFTSTEKVAVYWPNGPNTVTLVGYYDTVSEGNSAALAAVNDAGMYPHVIVNWWHSDFSHIKVGPIAHRDSREDMPAWYDEDPAY